MNYFETIYDINTDKTTTRKFTAEEIATLEAETAAELATLEAAKAQSAAKEAARLAVLEKLGLTADEVAALGL
jgi:hypothetical protein